MARKKKQEKTDILKEYMKGQKKARDRTLSQEMIFLTRKVAGNPLARDYYTQLKELLEELLMLDLAQRAVEATVKYETRNKIISIDDSSLAPFRAEMEKAKTLKLASGILSATGYLDVESALSRIEEILYGPKKPTENVQTEKIVSRLKELLDDYSKRMENLIKKERKNA